MNDDINIKNYRPSVVLNFLSEEEASILTKFLDKTSEPSPHFFNHRCALGYPSYQKAAATITGTSAVTDNHVVRAARTEDDLQAMFLLPEIYDRAKDVLGKFYNKKLSLVQANYLEYSPGPGQELHSDMHDSEYGGDIRNDGFSHVMRCSAVLHLTTGGGVDFTGGDLWFPKQDYRLTPVKASLVYFVGDQDHIHQVEDIDSGKRKSISMFFGYEEEILI